MAYLLESTLKFPDLDIELEIIRPKKSFKWVCENKGFPSSAKTQPLRYGS